jgi:putative hydrolase of the HAD superfamily
MRHYDAVFFDAANTLLYPFPSVGEIYAEVAGRYGITTSGPAVQRAFGQAWGNTQALAQGDPVRYGVGEPDGRRFWHTLVHEVFAQIALPDDFDTFFDELYWLFAQPSVWRLFQNVSRSWGRYGSTAISWASFQTGTFACSISSRVSS